MMCDAIYDQKKFGTNIYDLTETFVLLEETKKTHPNQRWPPWVWFNKLISVYQLSLNKRYHSINIALL